jgi:hypothetical protein
MSEFLKNYIGSLMAKDSKEGYFFLPEKWFQSQYGDCTTLLDEAKTFDNECMIFRR